MEEQIILQKKEGIRRIKLSCSDCGQEVERSTYILHPVCFDCKKKKKKKTRIKNSAPTKEVKNFKKGYDYTLEKSRVTKDCELCGKKMFVHNTRRFCSGVCQRLHYKKLST